MGLNKDGTTGLKCGCEDVRSEDLILSDCGNRGNPEIWKFKISIHPSFYNLVLKRVLTPHSSHHSLLKKLLS